MPLSVRALATSTFVLVVLAATSCGGNARYAGLPQGEAATLARARLEARLAPANRLYYETFISIIAAAHGETAPRTHAWLIGIWKGQTARGACALASRVDGTNHVQLIACAAFPKYAP